MFKENLLYIEREIDKVYQTDVMKKVVTDKLNKSLEKYVHNLEETCKYLLSQDSRTIVSFLNNDK